MPELTYDVDPAHVANCDKPIAACRECSQAYRLERVELAIREVVFHSSQLTRARERLNRAVDNLDES